MTKQGHFIVVPLGAWGHVRPLLHTSLNILVAHPGLHLTLLLIPSVIKQVESELASPACAYIYQTPQDGTKGISGRLQIIPVHSPQFELPEQFSPNTMAEEAMDFAQAVPSFLESVILGKPEVDGTKDVNKFAHLPPNFIVFDLFHTFLPEVMTSLMSSLNCPPITVLGFFPCNAISLYNHFAAAENGGVVPTLIKHVEEEVKGGVDIMDAYNKWGFAGTGRVIDPPGLEKMFDYELFPCAGAVPFPPQISAQIALSNSTVRHPAVDGIIMPTDSTFEKQAQAAFKSEIGKELIMVGMQFPSSVWDGEKLIRDPTKEKDERILQFLNKMQKKHGDKSVFYISFGSAFWPVLRPELVVWLIDSLIENKVPFVFAHASFMVQVVDPVILAKIKAYEDSIEVQFAPQWAVLEHPATGYFVSHCGSNSTAEAIMTQTPVAAFPFAADQKEFTYNLVKAGCAIEIKQVKTFKPTTMKKLYDGTEIVGTEEAVKAELADIWTRMRGEEGVKMRENMAKLKAIHKESWANGEARKAMEGISRFY